MQTYSKVYDSQSQAHRVVHELEAAGVPPADISTFAYRNPGEPHSEEEQISAAALGMGVGAVLGAAAGLLAGFGVLVIPGLVPVVAGGWFASTVIGLIGGSVGGVLFSSLFSNNTREADARVYSDAARRGGTMVTVRTKDFDARIELILNLSRQLSPMSLRSEHRKAAWKSVESNFSAYTTDLAEIERIRRQYD